MAQIKLAEYTFDNSVGDVMPSLTPNTITMTKEDVVSGTTTRRIVYIDDSVMPTQIGGFFQSRALLTLDYLNVTNNVTTIGEMFYQATNVTYINVSNWDTSNVTNMKSTFYQCEKLQTIEGLENWNVSKNTTFYMTFYRCIKLKEAKITNWKAPLCTNMHQMFRQCSALTNLDLSGFEVSTTSSVDMSRCFQQCDNLKITGLDTMKVKPLYLNFAFANITNTTIKNNFDFSTWDTSSCTNFGNMFEYSYSIETINVSNWDMSSTTSLGGMFNTCRNLKHIRGLDTWDVSGCGNFSSLFAGCTSLTDLSGVYNWDVSSANNLIIMFKDCSSLKELDLRNWVTSGATYSIEGMFYGCENLEVLRVDNFDTSKLTHSTSMGSIFYNCKKLKTLNLNSFTNPGTLGNINDMFSGCSSLEYISMSNFVWGNCTSMNGIFKNCTSLKMLDLTTLDSSTFSNKVYGISGIIGWGNFPVYYNSNICSSSDFTDISNRTNLIDVKGRLMAIYDFNNNETGTNMPALTGSTVTKTIDTQGSESHITHRVIGVDVMPTAISFNSIRGLLNVDYLAVTSSCTSLANLFGNCFRMTYVDTFGWDTSNVTSFGYCFRTCSSLTEIRNIQDLKVTSKVTEAYDFFNGCSKLTSLDLTHWDVSGIRNGSVMFSGCSGLTSLNISNWDVSSMQFGNSMFQGCTSLSELDLTSFKTTAMEGDNHNMFVGWTSDQIVYIHDTNWTINVSSYNATFIRRLSTLLARYTFDNSIGDCLPTFTGITSADYLASDIVNDTITTRFLSIDSDKTITKISFGSLGKTSSLLTLDYLKIDKNITTMNDMFQVCSNVTSINAENWDTSNVTNMAYMLQRCDKLTEVKGLGTWDTSKVTSMDAMFQNKAGNIKEIENWDVSSCKNFSYMFANGGINSELNLSNWQPNNLENCQNMFAYSPFTSINLSGWDVPKLNNMSSMFAGAGINSKLTSVNMSNWTMGTPANMNSMFYDNTNLTSIDFTGSKMISSNLQQTFQSCSKLTSLDVSGFDTSQCENINVIFADCAKLTEINGLENWDVSKVVNMNQVFSNCTVLANLDNISNWVTSKARYMYGVFTGCKGLTSLNINGWDVSKATTLQGCFSDLVMDSLDLSNWNVSQVNTFSFLFSGTKIKNINVSGWDTSAGTNFQYLFTSSTAFEEVDLSSWKVSSDANLYVAFNGCSTNQTIYYDPLLWQGSRQDSITWTVRPSKNNGYWLDMTGITGATEIKLFNENNLPTEEIITDWGDGTQNSELTHTYSTAGEYIVISNLQLGQNNNNVGRYLTKATIYYLTKPYAMFYACSKLTNVTLTDNWVELFNVLNETNGYTCDSMFYSCKGLSTLDTTQICKMKNITNMKNMFSGCSSLVELDLGGFDTSKVTSLQSTFAGCNALTSLNLDRLDLSSVTTMSSMCNNCYNLTTFTPPKNNTNNLKLLQDTFRNTRLLNYDFLNDWNLDQVTSFSACLHSCAEMTSFSFKNKHLPSTTNLQYMFSGCKNLQTVDLSGLTVDENVGLLEMFRDCKSLTSVDFSNSTIKPTSCANMFQNCSSLTLLDLSSWNVSKCTTMGAMFNGCSLLKSIVMPNGESPVGVMNHMFVDCQSLTNIDFSGFIPTKLTSIAYMFSKCYSLKEIDLSTFKSDNVTYWEGFFDQCSRLQVADCSNMKWNSTMGAFYQAKNFNTLGLIYLDADSVNKWVQSFQLHHAGKPLTIYYYDADPSQLIPVEGVTFKKYQVPTTIQLPPHIQLHSLPDGTRDEVDIKTGVLTRNVTVFTADEVKSVSRETVSTDGKWASYWLKKVGEGDNNDLSALYYVQLTNKLPVTFLSHINDTTYPHIGLRGNKGGISLRIPTNEVVGTDKNGCLQWLKDRNIVFYCKNQTPTTEQLILNYNNSCDYGRILPTGMCDKYDVVNSMYTQTMASILLDGANTWDAMEEFENTVKFTATGTTVGVENLNMLGAGGLYCDNDLFPNINDDSDVPHCRVDEAGNKFYIYVDKEMLMSPDLIGWQIWLQANKFNLIYELAEHLTYVKPYEELDATQARWEGMDCMRDGAITYHTNSSDNITMYPTLEYVAPSINNFEVTMLEPNTDYTIYAEGINTNDTINLGGTDISFNNGTVYTSGDNQWLRIDNNDSFYNMVITKGDTTGEVVPYFEGMTSVENPKVKTPIIINGLLSTAQGKWESSSHFGGSVVYVPMIDVKVGQKYIIASSSKISVAVWRSKTWVNNDATQIVMADVLPDSPLIFTPDVSQVAIFMVVASYLTDKAHEVELRMYEGEVDYGYLGRVENPQKVVERSTVSYTDLKLRSLPNGVKDTINVVTGEYVQRVGEVTFDGSEDEGWARWYAVNFVEDNHFYYIEPTYLSHYTKLIPDRLLCDTIKPTIENVWEDYEKIFINGQKLYISLPITKARDVEKFKQWLSNNPTTIQYELAEPIITKLDPQTLLAYKDGTINLSSDTGFLPTTHYTVPSTNTFHLPSMKTGTRYTLKYPSASGSITIGDINYSISSDSMLFTTPLKINGDTSAIIFSDDNPENVVLLEGAYNKREVPFFTGVKSVKNPNITIIDQLSTESTTYNCETEIELRGLPNGVADKLDIVKGKLTTNVGIRPYQEGDENLPNIWTDGYETVYALSSPVVTNVTIDRPTVTTNSLIALTSDYLIPQLNYRAPSSNNFPLDLLQPNQTYTLYADTLTSGSYTLGGTKTGIYSQPHTITLGDMTDNLLTFNGDLGLSNVMLVKGNSLKTSLPPYFLGIRSVTDGHLLVEGMAGEMNEITFDEGIVLRDCNGVKDFIDLMTCTLTKRTGEITLTGAEGWYRADSESTTDYNVFKLTLGGLKEALVMCDTLQSVFDTKMMDCIHAHTNELCIVIANATIGGNTVNALKSWLNQHPTTVVYQLRTPIEVQLENTWTTLPPTSYDNQTEISSTVSTNSLKPMISVTIATTTLEEIVSNLEAQNAQLEEENIATMLALTSVYELMSTPSVATTETQVATYGGMSVSPMGMVYARLVSKGFKTIEQVPYNLQPEVMYALRGME